MAWLMQKLGFIEKLVPYIQKMDFKCSYLKKTYSKHSTEYTCNIILRDPILS